VQGERQKRAAEAANTMTNKTDKNSHTPRAEAPSKIERLPTNTSINRVIHDSRELRRAIVDGCHEFRLLLNGGVYASKLIRFDGKAHFRIFNPSDGTAQRLAVRELYSKSNIGEAMRRRAFLAVSKTVINAKCVDGLPKIPASTEGAYFSGHRTCSRTSRSGLLAQGAHVEVSSLADEAGFWVQVFFDLDAFNRLTLGRNGRNDLFAAMLCLRAAIFLAPTNDRPISFQVGEVKLLASALKLDPDDQSGAITVILDEPTLD
jgi:hypothetical protein